MVRPKRSAASPVSLANELAMLTAPMTDLKLEHELFLMEKYLLPVQ